MHNFMYVLVSSANFPTILSQIRPVSKTFITIYGFLEDLEGADVSYCKNRSRKFSVIKTSQHSKTQSLRVTCAEYSLSCDGCRQKKHLSNLYIRLLSTTCTTRHAKLMHEFQLNLHNSYIDWLLTFAARLFGSCRHCSLFCCDRYSAQYAS